MTAVPVNAVVAAAPQSMKDSASPRSPNATNGEEQPQQAEAAPFASLFASALNAIIAVGLPVTGKATVVTSKDESDNPRQAKGQKSAGDEDPADESAMAAAMLLVVTPGTGPVAPDAVQKTAPGSRLVTAVGESAGRMIGSNATGPQSTAATLSAIIKMPDLVAAAPTVVSAAKAPVATVGSAQAEPMTAVLSKGMSAAQKMAGQQIRTGQEGKPDLEGSQISSDTAGQHHAITSDQREGNLSADNGRHSLQSGVLPTKPVQDMGLGNLVVAAAADNKGEVVSAFPARRDVKDAVAQSLESPRPLSDASAPAMPAKQLADPAPVAGRPPAAAEQVGQAIAARWGTLEQDGTSTVHLRLNPPDLGSVRIQLSAKDQVVSARVVVQLESTRDLLDSQVGLLRDKLMGSNVTLGQFSVTCDNAGGGQHWHQPGAETPLAPLATARPQESSAAAASTIVRPRGIIDVIA